MNHSLQSIGNRSILHRRIHLDDVPDYLVHGASKQLLLHRSRSPTMISDDDQSRYFTVQRDEQFDRSTRTYSALRSTQDQWTVSDKRQFVSERIIPVDHQRAMVIKETDRSTVKINLFFSRSINISIV